MANWKYHSSIDFGNSITALKFSHDSQFIAFGSFEKGQVIDVNSGKLIMDWKEDSSFEVIYDIEFLPDQKHLAISLDSRTEIKVRSIPTGEVVCELNGHKTGSSLSLDSTDKFFVSGGADNSVRFWDIVNNNIPNTDESYHILNFPDSVLSICISPSKDVLACACGDGGVRVLRMGKHEPNPYITVYEGLASAADSVRFSQDGKLIAAGCERNGAIVWDTNTHEKVCILRGQADDIYNVESLEFLNDGASIAIVDRGNQIKIHSISSGQQEEILETQLESLVRLALSPDKSFLVAGGTTGGIAVFKNTSLASTKSSLASTKSSLASTKSSNAKSEAKTSKSNWYYQEDGFEKGPFSATQFKKLVQNKKINSKTNIRKGEDGRWVQAKMIKGLFPENIKRNSLKNPIAEAIKCFKIPPKYERFLFCLPALYVANADGNVSVNELVAIGSKSRVLGLVRGRGEEYSLFNSLVQDTMQKFKSKDYLEDFDLLSLAIKVKLKQYPNDEAILIKESIKETCIQVAKASGPIFRNKVLPEEQNMLDKITSEILEE